MKDFQYHLEKYHGVSSRHECPNCHDKHSFAYYVDDNGNILDKTVGRCNHESACGYHYTPKQYFHDRPSMDKTTPSASSFNGWSNGRYNRPSRPPQTDYIPLVYLQRSYSTDSSLFRFLSRIFPIDTLNRVWEAYKVGATRNKQTIYWQVDAKGMIRTGKIMKYNEQTGHRVKDQYAVNWVHSKMKKQGLLPQTFNLCQCLFGEHLLAKYPDRDVALVEAEKTAVVCAAVFPNYVWVATGGKSNMSSAKMKALQGRRVIAFPDVDGYTEWQEKAEQLRSEGIRIDISDLLERSATDEERSKHIDIADWVIGQLSAKSSSATDGAPQNPIEQRVEIPTANTEDAEENECVFVPIVGSNGEHTSGTVRVRVSDIPQGIKDNPQATLFAMLDWDVTPAMVRTYATISAH